MQDLFDDGNISSLGTINSSGLFDDGGHFGVQFHESSGHFTDRNGDTVASMNKHGDVFDRHYNLLGTWDQDTHTFHDMMEHPISHLDLSSGNFYDSPTGHLLGQIHGLSPMEIHGHYTSVRDGLLGEIY